MKNNFNNFPQSLEVSTMAPLDAKFMVNTLDEILNLGSNDNKAFKYYRGMTIYCHETKTRYEWTDNLKGKVKLLPIDFKYPRGTEFDGINYSELSFNFIEFKTGADDLIINDEIIIKKIIKFNLIYLSNNDFSIKHNLNIDMIVNLNFIFPKKIYSEKSPSIFTLNELMMFDIIDSFEFENSNSFKLLNWRNYQNITDNDDINILIEYTELKIKEDVRD